MKLQTFKNWASPPELPRGRAPGELGATPGRAQLCCVAMVFLAGVLHADVDTTFTENTDIPIGNPLGIAPAGTVSGVNGVIASLTLELNVSGGFNGNLYAYLEAPNGTTVVFLDRPGVTEGNPFGYGGSGLNVTFSDMASGSLQTTSETYGSPVTGCYQPVDDFTVFDGLSGNGTWTLLVADDAEGGGQPELDSWSLDIVSEVPEAGQLWALALAGLAVAGLVGTQRFLRQLRRH